MKKIMGLDLGSVTCGVSTSDTLGMFASPLKTIRFAPDDYDDCLDKTLDLVKELKIETVVLGLPKHMNGEQGIRAEICKQFGQYLAQEGKVEVILWDERLSTVAASKTMIASNMNRKKRRENIDSMAAVIILQSYLDSIK